MKDCVYQENESGKYLTTYAVVVVVQG